MVAPLDPAKIVSIRQYTTKNALRFLSDPQVQDLYDILEEAHSRSDIEIYERVTMEIMDNWGCIPEGTNRMAVREALRIVTKKLFGPMPGYERPIARPTAGKKRHKKKGKKKAAQIIDAPVPEPPKNNVIPIKPQIVEETPQQQAPEPPALPRKELKPIPDAPTCEERKRRKVRRKKIGDMNRAIAAAQGKLEEIKRIFDPLLHTRLLIEELWEDYSYWKKRARVEDDTIPASFKPHIVKTAQLLKDAIKEARDFLKENDLIDNETKQKWLQQTNIQNLQVIIAETANEKNEIGGALSGFLSKITAAANPRELIPEKVIDTEVRSDKIEPSRSVTDSPGEPIGVGPE